MANNVIITSIEGDCKEENCKEKVLSFMKNQLKMEVKEEEVEVAHRLGQIQPDKKPTRHGGEVPV